MDRTLLQIEDSTYRLRRVGRLARRRMRIEGEVSEVKAGDAIAIPPGRKHKLWNTGDVLLTLLCCCAPCYEHSDTFITET